jgi:glycosyltransferase involved in cell wall biosynthesis
MVMNVAIFTDNDFAKVNGVTTTLRAVLEHQPDTISARIYTCDGVGAERPDYLALKALGFGIPFYGEMKMYVPPLLRFLRHAAADRIDVVHLTTPGPVGLAALWVASRHQLPIVGSFHTDLAEYTRLLSGSRRLGDLMREYMRWPYGKCRRILVPSESTREMLVRGKLDAARIGIWPRGVSTERFAPDNRSSAMRDAWGVDDTRPALLYVGRLSREKGLTLIAPLGRLLDHAGVPHRFVFVGDGPMRAELQSSCPDAIFTGTLPHDAVAVAMASADIFVFPSQTDTAGNVVLEAQASGCPVLVSDAGGPRENVRAGISGMVCHSFMDFVSHATALCRDAARRQTLGRGARDYALTRRWDLALEPLYRSYIEAGARQAVPPPVDIRPAVVA